jgi:ankyrin repeat protein
MHAACNERVGAGLALPHSDLDATIVKLLLPHSDLDATIAKHDARGGNSALMLAARSQRPDLVEALLAVGADASIADEEGWTALHLAAGAWPLAVQENAECVKLLLADSDTAAATKGSDPFSQGVHTEGGETPLEIAAISGNHEAVRLLLPVSDARHTAACGRTALMMAAELGLTDIVKTLLPFSDPLMIDARGESAFAIAAGIGHFECADALSRHSNALEVAKVFKKVGSEKLPGWAKHLAAQERKEIAAVVAQAEAAQARSAVATATPKAPTNKPSGRSMRL